MKKILFLFILIGVSISGYSQEGTYDILLGKVDSLVNDSFTKNKYHELTGMIAAYDDKVTLVLKSGKYVFKVIGNVNIQEKEDRSIYELETYDDYGEYCPSEFTRFSEDGNMFYTLSSDGYIFTYYIELRED